MSAERFGFWVVRENAGKNRREQRERSRQTEGTEGKEGNEGSMLGNRLS
jgi:hypothetical protein